MSATRPSHLFPEFASVPGVDDAFDRAYPHADRALAVAHVRGALGLDHAALARLVGATEQDVAAAEDGTADADPALGDRILALLPVTDADTDPGFVEVLRSTVDHFLDSFRSVRAAPALLGDAVDSGLRPPWRTRVDVHGDLVDIALRLVSIEGAPRSLEATLRREGLPLEGWRLRMAIEGVPAADAITDSRGVSTLAWPSIGDVGPSAAVLGILVAPAHAGPREDASG